MLWLAIWKQTDSRIQWLAKKINKRKNSSVKEEKLGRGSGQPLELHTKTSETRTLMHTNRFTYTYTPSILPTEQLTTVGEGWG